MTPALLSIGGEMNIYRAAELKQNLLDTLGEGVAVELDLSGVTDIDSAGLQLLMLAKNEAQARGGRMCLGARSSVVHELLELLDLGAWFGDPLVGPPRTTASARSQT
jgi:anti-anti-sigma factor